MKFYFEGQFVEKEGKLPKVSIKPDTNSRLCQEVFVLIAKEVGEPKYGLEYNFGLVGQNKTPMIFPPSKHDERILVMGDIPVPGHRKNGWIDREKTTGTIIREGSGGGAFGGGTVFLAILEPGQRVVSNRLMVWENNGGELLKKRFDTLAEYELAYDQPDIEML